MMIFFCFFFFLTDCLLFLLVLFFNAVCIFLCVLLSSLLLPEISTRIPLYLITCYYTTVLFFYREPISECKQMSLSPSLFSFVGCCRIHIAHPHYAISTARRRKCGRTKVPETQRVADKARLNGVRTSTTKCSLGTVRDSPFAITSRTFCPPLLPLHLRFRRERDTSSLFGPSSEKRNTAKLSPSLILIRKLSSLANGTTFVPTSLTTLSSVHSLYTIPQENPSLYYFSLFSHLLFSLLGNSTR